MKKSLFLLSLLAASLSVHAETTGGVNTTTNGTWVWTDVTITQDNQDNYLPGGGAFSDAPAATLNIGVSQGEGSLTIDGGSLVTPNCLFIGGKGWLNPDATETTHNGSVTVTNGGELTIAGCTWDGPYHNTTADGAQLSLANSSGGVSATLNVTNGGKVHANAGTVVAGGDCTAEINISGQGSVMDFALRGETQADYLTAYIGLDGTAQGTVNVSDGGKLTTTGSTVPLYMYLGTSGTSSGTLNVDGGTVEMGNSVAILGYGSGTNGAVNVKNGGSVVIGVAYVGNYGHGEFTVDETSTAVFGNMTIADGSRFTNQGTAVFYGKLSMSGKAVLDGSGTLNLLEGATLTNSNCNLDVNTLLVEGNSTANLSSDAAGTLKIASIITVFDSAAAHSANADAAAVLVSGTNGASDLANTTWFFELSDAIAETVTSDGTSTQWLTNLTGVKANSYYNKTADSWFDAVSAEDGSGTYVVKKEVATVEATLTNTEGSVTIGEEISTEQNHATIDTTENQADLYVRVETTATTTGDTNGELKVTQGTTEYDVRDAYISNTLTLDKTDLVAWGTVNAQSTVNLTDSSVKGDTVNIQSASVNMTNGSISSTQTGAVANAFIKGTGELTNLTITDSLLIAGNSPGLMTLTGNQINGGSMLFYVGTETAAALTGSATDAISLTQAPLVSSGFEIATGTTLTGTIVLELWSMSSIADPSNPDVVTYAYNAGRMFDTIGQSLQLFILSGGDVSGANFVLGDTFAEATTWNWDTSELKTKGIIRVVPEPATATLSLLALAALAARRRRKG